MNVQPMDGVKDTQLQAVEPSLSTRNDDAGGRTSTVPAGSDRQNGKDKDKKSDGPDVASIARQADQYFQAKGVNLHFKVSDNNQAVQVEMVEEGTDKVICKIPSDDIVKLQENMKRMAKGVKDVSV